MIGSDQNRLAWVALTLTPGLGPKRILKAAEALPDLASVFRLSLTELESLNFPAPSAQFLFTGKARTEAERELVRMGEQRGVILTFADEEYPERLREIFDPPPVLWCWVT
jgi:DNA processing protein